MSKERVIFNPPFQMAGEFIDYFENVKRRESKFLAVGIIPERSSRDWFKLLMANNMWQIVMRWPRGTLLFSKPMAKNLAKRCVPMNSREPVIAIVFNDST